MWAVLLGGKGAASLTSLSPGCAHHNAAVSALPVRGTDTPCTNNGHVRTRQQPCSSGHHTTQRGCNHATLDTYMGHGTAKQWIQLVSLLSPTTQVRDTAAQCGAALRLSCGKRWNAAHTLCVVRRPTAHRTRTGRWRVAWCVVCNGVMCDVAVLWGSRVFKHPALLAARSVSERGLTVFLARPLFPTAPT